MYGTIVDLSLGGVRMCLKGDLDAKRVELSPKKALPSGMAVIPLPYDVRWQDGEEAILAGLQFAGGTDAFFRGCWVESALCSTIANSCGCPASWKGGSPPTKEKEIVPCWMSPSAA